MYWCEFAIQPEQRSGKMIPVNKLPEFYKLDDAGYSSYYWFREEDAREIQKQGHSGGLSRFPVYTRYLVVDIDRENDTSAALRDMEQYTAELRGMALKHSVWVSGGKGFHIYIHCEPMEGIDVPHSQLCWVKERNWKVDLTLYQHGRLLSNPGRKSKKTGVRKHKIRDFDGQLLVVPRIEPPVRTPRPTEVGTPDLARIALYRAQKILEEQPSSRHTTLWSVAGAFAEAGAPEDLTIEVLSWINSMWKEPKDHEGLVRAVRQAYLQTSHKPSLKKEAGLPPTSEV